MATIESLMHSPLVTVTTDEPVAQVARQLAAQNIGAMVVMEGDAIAGIFTERDLLTKVVAEGRDPAKTLVGEVATRDVISVEIDAPLSRCAGALRDGKIRHIPIVRDARPVGILSARDFFEALAGDFERFIERARYEEALRGDVDPYDHVGAGYGR